MKKIIFRFNKKSKLLLIIFIFFCLLGLMSNKNPDTTNNKTEQESTTSQQESTTSQPESTKSISNYDIVETWTVKDAFYGKRITMPSNLQTEEGLLLVCDQIEKDTKNDIGAVVFGHKDTKSAEIQKRYVQGKTSAEEEEYLGKNFLLDFKKNSDTGFHQCTIYPNGVDEGTQKVKTY